MNIIKGTAVEILPQLARRETSEDLTIETQVRGIIQQVRQLGDAALFTYSAEFDGLELTQLEVTDQLTAAYERVEPEVIAALEAAKENILSYHRHQIEDGFLDTARAGVLRGQLVQPLARVGIYVPGGTAAYPSSVLMNVLPAKLAGVEEIVMVTPPGAAGVPDVILAAAKIAGVDRVFQVGGAQAIAALAYGTESIPRVAKIVGPGNVYVATAKKLVFGQVGIDMIAGPSEIGILATTGAKPDYLAADLLSQAEHDRLARAILVTDDQELAEAVVTAVAAQLPTLPRKDIAAAAWQEQSLVIVVPTQADMFTVMNELAPEHLEIQMPDPLQYLQKVKNAGSVFLGDYASEPVGDYYAGTNHVLPTSGTAKFSSPLGVYDFVKRTQYTYYTKEALAEDQAAIATLARKEGLEAHARAIEIRFKEETK